MRGVLLVIVTFLSMLSISCTTKEAEYLKKLKSPMLDLKGQCLDKLAETRMNSCRSKLLLIEEVCNYFRNPDSCEITAEEWRLWLQYSYFPDCIRELRKNL